MNKERKTILAVTLFAIAMAFLESTIVVYLRKIYYPDGFNFPLKGFIEPQILNIEWVREAFTIIMLLSIGYLAAKTFNKRFAYFLYSFAIWDIFYYVWLYVMLGWPSSLLTWDILFLIPWTWAGPVLAPVICSLTMILLAFSLTNKKIKISEWSLWIIGSLFILYTFLIDYGKLVLPYAKDFFTLSTNPSFFALISSYVPSYYNWSLFLIGEAIILFGIYRYKYS